MEEIRRAVERARANQETLKSLGNFSIRQPTSSKKSDLDMAPLAPLDLGIEEIQLNTKHLKSRGVVSYDGKDQRSRPYDVLRTRVTQSMNENGWKILGVTSPTPRCGKTSTAINLGFSMARQQGRSVALLDLDLQRPQLSHYLEIASRNEGTLGVLEGRTIVGDAVTPVRAGDQRMVVMTSAGTKESAELMVSHQMEDLLRNCRRDFNIVILDLPPILSGDDVIALLPRVDCVLLVVAAGLSKVAEVEDCMRHLQSSKLVRVVFNKATDADTNHYYY